MLAVEGKGAVVDVSDLVEFADDGETELWRRVDLGKFAGDRLVLFGWLLGVIAVVVAIVGLKVFDGWLGEIGCDEDVDDDACLATTSAKLRGLNWAWCCCCCVGWFLSLRSETPPSNGLYAGLMCCFVVVGAV